MVCIVRSSQSVGGGGVNKLGVVFFSPGRYLSFSRHYGEQLKTQVRGWLGRRRLKSFKVGLKGRHMLYIRPDLVVVGVLFNHTRI